MVSRFLKQAKKGILSLTPVWALLLYHQAISYLTAILTGSPSKKMLVIGVTGTKGKTSTANFLHAIFESAGLKTGLVSTANIKIGQLEKLNPYHMSMPGRGRLHFLVKDICKAGCQVCIIEVTSEGLKQNRHTGIWFDVAIFTNLTPEHLTSHNNSFEDYKQAKLKLFKALEKRSPKFLGGKYQPKIIVANFDSPHYDDFTNFKVDEKISYGENPGAEFVGTVKNISATGLDSTINNQDYYSPIPGAFNLLNILAAIATTKTLGLADELIKNGIENLNLIPGRMEEIKNHLGFKVYVDYAHEKESMERVLKTGRNLTENNGRVIVLFGAEGGGRDKSKRQKMAILVNDLADLGIVTNVDPYDDDPLEIAEDIAKHFTNQDKVKIILDRKQAITEALKLAKAGDVILITGKGAEQSIIIDGQSSYWDDRVITREILSSLN